MALVMEQTEYVRDQEKGTEEGIKRDAWKAS